uniref:receptor protein-tyrosine kinase n=1 Tax=Photinus pyralis TaxID=7054 RepID=A0A1Y1M7M7_PHOPY
MLLYKLILCVLIQGVLTTTTGNNDVEDDYEYDYDDIAQANFTANGTLQFIKDLTNITKPSGKTVTLTCEVKNLDANSTNTRVQFTWRKNNAKIDESKRIVIKHHEKPGGQIYGSSLKIKNLESFDKGFYVCMASNGNGDIRSEALLDVTNDRWGTSVTFKPIFEDTRSRSDITTFFPDPKRDFHTFSHPIFPTSNMEDLSQIANISDYDVTQPFCQTYQGTTCREYLDGKLIFVQPPYTQENIEIKLEQAVLVVSQSNEISTSCSKFAIPSLCFSAFPICIDPKHVAHYQKDFTKKYLAEQDKSIFKNLRNKLSMSLQRICKEECELLEKELCRREYAIAKRHPIISQPLELDECEFLPDESDKNSMYCLSLGVERTQNVNEDELCYWDYGESYRGVYDATISNKKCIRWSHQFTIALSEYPELSGHSYCRNPGRTEAEPFCFVDQTRKEVCGLPKCASMLWMYLIVGGLIVLIIAVVIILSIYCHRARKRRKTRLQNMSVPTADKNIYGNTGPNSPMELNTLLPTRINNMPPRSQSSQRNGFQPAPQYTYKEVTFVEELGEGAFGKVYKGELKTKAGKIIVAVKSLKENASAKTQADFQREIELISELKHPNIICLLGVVVKQEPMCMLFEFMSEGDLHEFLIANSPNEGKSLSQHQFLHIASQIAQGMEYLSDNHYVHRDLAARNCLVSKNFVVKISDFGLSRDMYSCDYYRVQSKSLLPVRWMPPESILYGKFTTESDVWSYGVVLWEIYSYGLQPYYGYNNQEVISMIRSRKLLPCPDACPSYCYVLMVECWAELAMRRPNFGEIVQRLKMWKQNGSASGSYCKPAEAHPRHSSKSSHASDSPTVCASSADPPHIWDLKKVSSNKLNESQSSLTSHSSSLGNSNKTQSTSLSNENSKRKSIDRRSNKNIRPENVPEGYAPKNIVVNSNGDTFETKLTF